MKKVSRHKKHRWGSTNGLVWGVCLQCYDLLIAKLDTYGLSENAIAFVYSCLMWIKEGLKTNHVEPLFRLLLSGVFQGSILYLILFNNFTFDLLMFIKEANRANFSDGNTFNILSKDIKILINLSEKEIKIAVKWSEENNMVVNQWKRQTFISNRRSKSNCHSTLKINKWITEAVVHRGSVKKMFLKISQNSQENNTCDRISFLKKLQNLGL